MRSQACRKWSWCLGVSDIASLRVAEPSTGSIYSTMVMTRRSRRHRSTGILFRLWAANAAQRQDDNTESDTEDLRKHRVVALCRRLVEQIRVIPPTAPAPTPVEQCTLAIQLPGDTEHLLASWRECTKQTNSNSDNPAHAPPPSAVSVQRDPVQPRALCAELRRNGNQS